MRSVASLSQETCPTFAASRHSRKVFRPHTGSHLSPADACFLRETGGQRDFVVVTTNSVQTVFDLSRRAVARGGMCMFACAHADAKLFDRSIDGRCGPRGECAAARRPRDHA